MTTRHRYRNLIAYIRYCDWLELSLIGIAFQCKRWSEAYDLRTGYARCNAYPDWVIRHICCSVETAHDPLEMRRVF